MSKGIRSSTHRIATYLQFSHERLHRLQENSSAGMRDSLLVKSPLDRLELSVELLRLDHRSSDDVQPIPVQSRDEVHRLLRLNDLLEFEVESTDLDQRTSKSRTWE